MLYLDTSALVKLVVVETETESLRAALEEHADLTTFSSALAAAELLRAVHAAGDRAASTARSVLARLHLVDVTRGLLERAGTLRTAARLRSLDAIHLVTAMSAQHRLVAIVTYEVRMADAAEELGLVVSMP